MKKLELLPALDIRAGEAVRLIQGDPRQQSKYGSALDVALEFQSAGAEWIHLVDLDAAFRTGSNYDLLVEVIGKLDVKIQLSGGIRDQESLERALATGCHRVNLSTSALLDLSWCESVIKRFGERVAVGLDVTGRTLAARGDSQEVGDIFEVLKQLDGYGSSRYVLTDVSRDGTLQGPNLNLIKSICSETDRPVIASGGISQLSDIQSLRELTEIGVEGAIIGKALYAHNFTIGQALEVAEK
ncbi:MAG: bifunctional 1-(5-phosphoribosyl)-5-((5-phosphoribosylamino)methylideneamino)imidazole-4-carboxamide isomerase/phosphoribosylanthranilate isomerase PriA [Candidatus Nanopelagicaceae bacterium]